MMSRFGMAGKTGPTREPVNRPRYRVPSGPVFKTIQLLAHFTGSPFQNPAFPAPPPFLGLRSGWLNSTSASLLHPSKTLLFLSLSHSTEAGDGRQTPTADGAFPPDPPVYAFLRNIYPTGLSFRVAGVEIRESVPVLLNHRRSFLFFLFLR